MISNNIYRLIRDHAEKLKLDLPEGEAAKFVQENDISEEGIDAIVRLMGHLCDKKDRTTMNFLLKTSRMPQNNPRTLDNFDFGRLKGPAVKTLQNLRDLRFLYSHQNLIFIGPTGIGKTHLALAYGYQCCTQHKKVYFLTFSELNQKMNEARLRGRIGSFLNGLTKPACLIIDEVGHCVMDEANTDLFFQIVQRRSLKDTGSMIMTSNYQPSEWHKFFAEKESLLCSLDRITDNAVISVMQGRSYRGKKREILTCEVASERTAA